MTTMKITVSVATDMCEGRTHAKVILDTDDISVLVNMGIDSIADLIKDAEKRSMYNIEREKNGKADS